MDVRLTIDGHEVKAPKDMSLLDVARRVGGEIPALCHHEGIAPIAACRLCLVEVRRPGRGEAVLTTSCDYPVSEGLEVVTASPRIRRHRAMNLQLLLPYAPDAPALHEIAESLGVTAPLFAPVTGAPLPGCILCELCVRVCAALGYHALAAIGRGDHKRVGPPFGRSVATACVGCGACHEVCPTGCIAMEDTATTRRIWGRELELFTCRRCGKPFTTVAHRTVMVARGDIPAESCDLCETCRSRDYARRLAPVR
ncbi:MAG TPA: 2Fe-2S iron-sulfur cluster-binding protein [Thermoleophilia bacterium]|nr:2Fe-2S iron-sulfur cluster-binding protein [Thermoleophilia bacterium]